MTETQAKSGASGASTDAPDSGQRDSASRADAPTDAAGAATTAARDTDRDTESPSGSARLESPTNVIRSAPSTTSASSSAAADEKSAPAGSSAGTYTPRAAATTPAPTPVPTSPAMAGAAGGRLTDPEPTVRTSTSVPVVGVPPIKVAPSAVSATSTGRTTTASPSPGTGAIGAAGTSATGRASVVPTAPKTTVTGTGLRQTSGATSVVGAPARPGAAAVGAARVSDTLRSARATVTGAASRGPRRARLHLKRIDPWSVMKFSFAVSLVLFVVAIVATSVLYLALDAMNVFDSINKAFAEVTGQNGTGATGGFKITAKGVIGTAVLLGAVNMVLFTALATLGAFVYNVCADLVGGVELTLSEKE